MGCWRGGGWGCEGRQAPAGWVGVGVWTCRQQGSRMPHVTRPPLCLLPSPLLPAAEAAGGEAPDEWGTALAVLMNWVH